ncbi:D-hexose-6-phosphate mutarotase [Altericista sp. CCNU0014]|uniref:D-hexose-6-phosphate mutarotase n=1 Tax=Altericista sp. CCNU0014 TaxID=3082949 RepID=UPI00385013B4
MSIEQLNTQYGLADQLKFFEGKGGFPFIEICNKSAKALISVYSGQVLSFQPASEPEDLLFLSRQAYYQDGKAIKGGIPICWPWFGPDPEGLGRSSHGFVRNRLWTVVSTEAIADAETKVILGLSDTAETQSIWPQSFELAIEVTVGNTLTVELVTRNRGDRAFSISQALHTYFKVGDIRQVRVLGLEDGQYLDKVDGGTRKTQQGSIAIDREVDRIYMDVKGELTIDDAALNRQIQIAASGSKTAIVWNPWAEICAGMADLEDDDYRSFVCVETANAANEIVEIPARGEYRLRATYAVRQR